VNRYLDALEPALAERGFTSLRSADPALRSCTLSMAPPRGTSAPALREALARAGVTIAIPDGLVRFAPHWPNDPARELPRVIAALDQGMR
jgi:hypothetical protein